MARFYIEGYEVDVQDPTFFLSTDNAMEINETLQNYIEDYA